MFSRRSDQKGHGHFMLLQLKPLFMGEQESLPLDVELDLSAMEFQGQHPLVHPVHLTGAVEVSADVVMLRAAAEVPFDGQCDRCMEPFHRVFHIPMEHILVTSLNNGENDDFILIENYQLPLSDLVETDILLELPSKNLCKEDCRGLCPQCGKNLNEGLCGCRREIVDPRLEVLKQLIQ